ncbi:MAG: macro domain-containing protein [Nocardioides sp.]|uniref:macro domain-containing protein n=1 Tax=Nocardioides sp. TaxID=35761 RepID=UPI0032647EBA
MQFTRDIKNKRFWRGLAIHGLAALGVIALVLELFDLFSPNTLGKINSPEILLVPIAAVLYAIWRSWPYPVEQHYATPDTKIRLVTGDLFAQDTNLVIGMADTFDVATPHIIAQASVQGQLLEKVYRHDVTTLHADTQLALAGKTVIGKVAKEGNTDRYPLGTVATIKHQRTHYFCVAYTSLDENNKASSSIGVLWEALEKLWDEVRIKSNGEPVSAPVIGLGQSGMSTVLPMQDAIRFLIMSFMFASRHKRVCEELVIVIRPEDEKRVDMLEVQDFLASLRKSS